MLPLFSYFQQLQQRGQALGMAEYKLLLEALGHKETSPQTAEELLSLCRHLWYKPGQNIKLFEDLFWDSFDKEQKQSLAQLEEEERRIQQEENVSRAQEPRSPGGPAATINEGTQKETKPSGDTDQSKPDTAPEEMPEAEQDLRPDIRVPEHSEEFIFLNIHPRAGTSGTIAIEAGSKDSGPQRTFSFDGGYAPLSRRELQNVWRYLPTRQLDKRNSDRLDVKTTVKEIARVGEQAYFQPRYHQEYIRESGLILLVDHLGSMIAFDDFASEVEAAARDWFLQHDKAAGVRRYYFQNIPEKYLYLNTSHTEFHPVRHLRSKFGLSPKPMLIISDAGASKGMYNEQRVEATAEALKALGSFASPVVWLNPLPARRWEGTSAEAINHVLGGAMCEATPTGFMRAINILRGKKIM